MIEAWLCRVETIYRREGIAQPSTDTATNGRGSDTTERELILYADGNGEPLRRCVGDGGTGCTSCNITGFLSKGAGARSMLKKADFADLLAYECTRASYGGLPEVKFIL